MIIADVICFVSASCIFGVRTLWRWHRRVETLWNGTRPYFKCLCNLRIKLVSCIHHKVYSLFTWIPL